MLLFVGRIQPLKAPDLAIRALAALGRRPDAVLVIVGGASGADGDRGGRPTSARSPSSSASPTGSTSSTPQPHHILSSYYRAADVVIVPSRSESFGLVALEAAACGVPVVASAVGGLLDVVVDGVTGLLVPGRDPADYAAALAGVLDDPAGAAAMGAAAAERARAYTWRAAADRLAGLYGASPSRPARRLAPARVTESVHRPARRRSLARTERAIDAWLAAFAAASPAVRAVDRGDRRRRAGTCACAGEAKDFTTVWLTLGQRTLRYETYVMPAPEANAGRVVRAPVAPERAARRRPLLDRRRGRGVPQGRAHRRRRSPRPSSTA